LFRLPLTGMEAQDIVFLMSQTSGAGRTRAQMEEEILDALRTVKDPDLRKDIVTLKFVKDLRVDDGKASFTIELTTPACPVKKDMEQWAREAVMKVNGIRDVEIRMTSAVSTRPAGSVKKPIDGVKNIIAIGSGKGGVGKSTVTVNLAVALAHVGAKVGLMDADIYGPNIPLMMGIMDRPRAVNNRIQPISNYGVDIMSMGFLMSDDTALIWRGPMLHSAIQQFIRDVNWGELDYLLIDLPPGTGDVQLTLTQTVPLMGAIVVSTPQDVALQDARKAIKMFRQVKVDILGIVENMSYFQCPNCKQRTNIFSHGGGASTAEQYQVPFLGEVPLDVTVREGGDSGKPIVLYDPDAPAAKAFAQIAGSVAAQVSISNLNNLSNMIIQ
jgi:ATP-binding protein involved in chromosome partitioning